MVEDEEKLIVFEVWLEAQLRNSAYWRLVMKVVASSFYALCFLVNLGLDFPQTNSVILSLPRIFAAVFWFGYDYNVVYCCLSALSALVLIRESLRPGTAYCLAILSFLFGVVNFKVHGWPSLVFASIFPAFLWIDVGICTHISLLTEGLGRIEALQKRKAQE